MDKCPKPNATIEEFQRMLDELKDDPGAMRDYIRVLNGELASEIKSADQLEARVVELSGLVAVLRQMNRDGEKLEEPFAQQILGVLKVNEPTVAAHDLRVVEEFAEEWRRRYNQIDGAKAMPFHIIEALLYEYRERVQ